MVFEFHIYTGPMFSGKSSELLRQMSRYKASGKRVLLINHSNDTRTDDFIETHNHHIKMKNNFAKNLY